MALMLRLNGMKMMIQHQRTAAICIIKDASWGQSIMIVKPLL
jgi:hypothetical protein